MKQVRQIRAPWCQASGSLAGTTLEALHPVGEVVGTAAAIPVPCSSSQRQSPVAHLLAAFALLWRLPGSSLEPVLTACRGTAGAQRTWTSHLVARAARSVGAVIWPDLPTPEAVLAAGKVVGAALGAEPIACSSEKK